MTLGRNMCRNAPVLPLPSADLEGKIPEYPIHEVGGLEVGAVDHVVGAVRVIQNPRAFVGGVVVDEIGETEDVPVILHDVHESPHILHRVVTLLEMIFCRVKEIGLNCHMFVVVEYLNQSDIIS